MKKYVFCYTCGAKMKVIKEVAHYKEGTGRPVYRHRTNGCPVYNKKPWYKKWNSQDHPINEWHARMLHTWFG